MSTTEILLAPTLFLLIYVAAKVVAIAINALYRVIEEDLWR